MATLTEVAQVAKRGVLASVVLVVSLVVGRILWTYGLLLYKSLNPPPCPTATARFGLLPRIIFPESGEELSYQLETPNGKVESFGPNARVYFVSSKRSNLLALDRVKSQAQALGFLHEPERVSETVYRWDKSDPLPARLEMNIITGSFQMDVAWETDPGFLQNKLLPDEEQAVRDVKTFLKRPGLLKDDLESGESVTTVLGYKGGEFIRAVSLSEADFVMVDLFRAPLVIETPEEATPEQLRCMDKQGSGKVIPAEPGKGLARVLVSGSRDQGERYVSAEYRYTQVEYEQYETYPIISGLEAWKKLQAGEGFVAEKPNSGTAMVRRVDLGYYDALDGSNYLQPIYIFTGDDFMGYVPAVKTEYLQQEGSGGK